MQPYFKTELKWGVVLGALTLLWNILERLTGFDSDYIELHTISGYLFLIPFITIYVLALLEAKKNRGGSLSFVDGLKTSFRIALYSIPFVVLASYLKIAVISPDFQNDMVQYLITTGAEETDVQSACSTVPFLMMSAAYAMTGVVVGAVAMLFIKK